MGKPPFLMIARSSYSDQMNTEGAPLSGFDPLDLRRALGSFGTGVTIVTTRPGDRRLVGVTANSFSSVSLDPPIVLWSLLRSSPSLSAFDDAGRFVVNVLAEDQVSLSRRFAHAHPDRFSGVEYRPGIDGIPLIAGCTAAFQCRTISRQEVGDHVLILGEIDAYEHRHGPTLLFCQGRYARASSLEQRRGTDVG